MGRPVRVLVYAVAVLLAGVAAATDFSIGLEAYDRQDYAEARRLLQEYAEVGNKRAQFAIGAMLAGGLGGDKDVPAGLGWLLSSAQNGFPAAREQAPRWLENKARLSAADRARTDAVIAARGAEAVRTKLLPLQTERRCDGYEFATAAAMRAPVYPMKDRRNARSGSVLVHLVIGADGLPRAPMIMASFPEHQGFEEAVVHAVLSSRYRPARFAGHPVESEANAHYQFNIIDGGYLWNYEALETVRKQADAGVVDAQFLLASVILADDRPLGVTRQQAIGYLGAAALNGHAHAESWVAEYLQLTPECGLADSAKLWARLGAYHGDPLSRLLYALMVLKGEPSPGDLEEARTHLAAVLESDIEFARVHAIGTLATSPAEAVRNVELVRIAIPKLKIEMMAEDPQSWESLAAAEALSGDFASAITHQQRALRLAEGFRWKTTVMAERLTRYRDHSTWQGDLYALPPAAYPVPLPSGAHICDSVSRNPDCVHEIPEPKKPTPGAPIGSLPTDFCPECFLSPIPEQRDPRGH